MEKKVICFHEDGIPSLSMSTGDRVAREVPLFQSPLGGESLSLHLHWGGTIGEGLGRGVVSFHGGEEVPLALSPLGKDSEGRPWLIPWESIGEPSLI